MVSVGTLTPCFLRTWSATLDISSSSVAPLPCQLQACPSSRHLNVYATCPSCGRLPDVVRRGPMNQLCVPSTEPLPAVDEPSAPNFDSDAPHATPWPLPRAVGAGAMRSEAPTTAPRSPAPTGHEEDHEDDQQQDQQLHVCSLPFGSRPLVPTRPANQSERPLPGPYPVQGPLRLRSRPATRRRSSNQEGTTSAQREPEVLTGQRGANDRDERPRELIGHKGAAT
jgi:hypothetical protein